MISVKARSRVKPGLKRTLTLHGPEVRMRHLVSRYPVPQQPVSRTPRDELHPATGCQQTEYHRFCGQRYDGFGRVGCPSRETSRRPQSVTKPCASVDPGGWIRGIEKGERPLESERDERPPRLVLATGHTMWDRLPVGHRPGAGRS